MEHKRSVGVFRIEKFTHRLFEKALLLFYFKKSYNVYETFFIFIRLISERDKRDSFGKEGLDG